MPKKAAALKPKAGPRKKGRGGRKPGVWTLVQPEQILAFRKQNKLSRAAFADMVGVSSTSVTNWESGKGAAFPAAQAKIAEVMGSAPATATATKSKRTPVSTAPIPTNGQHPSGYDSVVEGTARIVAAFLATAKVGRAELGAVVREVRAALA